jgi:hypothetical protein
MKINKLVKIPQKHADAMFAIALEQMQRQKEKEKQARKKQKG